MAESAIQQAIKQICEEKNISYESVIETIQAALAVAYRKDFGEKDQNINAEFNPETGEALVFDVKTVTEDKLKAEYDKEMAELEAQRAKEAEEAEKAGKPKPEEKREEVKVDKRKREEVSDSAGEPEEDEEPRWDPKSMISLTDAKKDKKTAKIGDVIRTQLFPPEAYGRMAAQTAKQVIIQRLREAERENLYQEYKGQEGKIITGTVQRIEGRTVFVDLGMTTAVIPPSEQVRAEHYQPGMRLKFFVLSVDMTPKGPEIHISRSHPEMVKQLFSIEVPEIASGIIEIKSVAREGGIRSKIAVQSNEANVDPVGSCVGQRGSRVQTVISELGGEKIDIIEYDDDPVKFIINALSPAKVLSVKINDEEQTAIAEVKEDQLSLAIGKAGQNVRLAAKLTGWKIDIMKEDSDEIVTEGGSEDEKDKKSAKGEKEESKADDEESKDEKVDSEESKDDEPAEEEDKKEDEKPSGKEKAKAEEQKTDEKKDDDSEEKDNDSKDNDDTSNKSDEESSEGKS